MLAGLRRAVLAHLVLPLARLLADAFVRLESRTEAALRPAEGAHDGPPAEWLAMVRRHAPQLLDPRRRGKGRVIDFDVRRHQPDGAAEPDREPTGRMPAPPEDPDTGPAGAGATPPARDARTKPSASSGRAKARGHRPDPWARHETRCPEGSSGMPPVAWGGPSADAARSTPSGPAGGPRAAAGSAAVPTPRKATRRSDAPAGHVDRPAAWPDAPTPREMPAAAPAGPRRADAPAPEPSVSSKPRAPRRTTTEEPAPPPRAEVGAPPPQAPAPASSGHNERRHAFERAPYSSEPPARAPARREPVAPTVSPSWPEVPGVAPSDGTAPEPVCGVRPTGGPGHDESAGGHGRAGHDRWPVLPPDAWDAAADAWALRRDEPCGPCDGAAWRRRLDAEQGGWPWRRSHS